MTAGGHHVAVKFGPAWSFGCVKFPLENVDGAWLARHCRETFGTDTCDIWEAPNGTFLLYPPGTRVPWVKRTRIRDDAGGRWRSTYAAHGVLAGDGRRG